MGKLIEQPIKALYNGVSRQPHNIRLTSQVQESENTLHSVVTGGFEKRPCSQHIITTSGLQSSGELAVHPIDRDPTEQYLVLIDTAGVLQVYDVINNVAKTVNAYSGAVDTYLTTSNPRTDLAFVTIADYTIIVNRNTTVTLDAGVSDTTNGSHNTTVTTITVDSTTGFPSAGAIKINNEVMHYTGTTSTTFTGVTRAQNSTTAGTHSDGATVIPAVKAYVDTFGDLAASGATGIHAVTNGASTLDDFYVVYDDETASWVETVKPGLQNGFTSTTMPHKLVRNADTTWTVGPITWDTRPVGDETTVPAPQFVGRKINDVFFFRNRLGLLADENVFFSKSADFFDLWPDKATEVLATDPIDVAASSTKVTLLRWAVPFRKSLFLSADRAQFELSTTGLLTPSNATIDLATNYSTPNYAKPVPMGDEIYFAGTSGDNTVVYEYFVEDDTLTNVALDVTKHAEGYVPSDVTLMAGDPTTGRLFCYTDVADGTDNDQVYTYSVYFDGNEKAQSAWSRWDFDCTAIKGMAVIEGYLFLVTDRDGVTLIEKVPLMQEAPDATLGHAIMLNARVNLTGSYSSGTGLTTWTLPYKHRSKAEGILPAAFGTNAGKKLALTYITSGGLNQVTAVGNFSANAATFGMPYTMTVEFSKQYLRERDQSAILNGRFQLRRMKLYFTDTGYFQAVVTPENRSAKTYTMTGRILGSSTNIVGKPALLTDVWDFPIKSRGDRVTIQIKNDSHMPCVINSAVTLGYFNEITRQE